MSVCHHRLNLQLSPWFKSTLRSSSNYAQHGEYLFSYLFLFWTFSLFLQQSNPQSWTQLFKKNKKFSGLLVFSLYRRLKIFCLSCLRLFSLRKKVSRSIRCKHCHMLHVYFFCITFCLVGKILWKKELDTKRLDCICVLNQTHEQSVNYCHWRFNKILPWTCFSLVLCLCCFQTFSG